MKFIINSVKIEDIFEKGVEDIFRDVLGFVYDSSIYKYRDKARFINNLPYFEDSTVNLFEDVLQCIALNVANVDYIVEDVEDVSSDTFEFNKVFSCSYDEFYKGIMLIISNYLGGSFSLTETNLVNIFKLFTNSITWDVGFLEVCDAEKYLSSLGISESEFRDLLPEIVKSGFDDLIESQKKAYSDYNFKDQECVDEVISELDYKYRSEINWIEIRKKYEEQHL